MAINFKPINELPEIESVSAGDKLIVNSGGAAKQIDASKVGGGSSADIIYVDASGLSEGGMAQTVAYADKDMTIPMTYAQGKAALLAGNAIMMLGVDEGMCMFPMMAQVMDSDKRVMTAVISGAASIQLILIFSDTEGV